MSELRKANTDHPYFLTLTINGWIDLFTRERYCDILIACLKYCIDHKGMLLFEYVIMSSHVHLIAQHPEGRLGEVIRDLKSYSAREIIRSLEEPGESRRDWIKNLFRMYADGKKQNKEYSVWQKTQHPVELSWPEIYDQKVEYIIMNPVSCGLVSDEAAWKYGSMGSYSPLRLTAEGTIETGGGLRD
jgi:putative transposase